MLEDRPYCENSTVEEIHLIENRVYIWESSKNIIFLNEVSHQSVFTVNLVFDKIEKLTRDLPRFGMLVNLSNIKRPDAETRRTVNYRYGQLKKMHYCSIYTGKNQLLNTTVKFIMYGFKTGANYAVVKSQQEAIKKIEDALFQ